MKYVRLTVRLGILPLLLLLLTGCQKEDTADNKDKAPGITLALTIPASESALTRATTDPLTGENTLSNVYVLFYQKGGANTTIPSLFHAETINKEEKWTYTIPGTDLSRLTGGTAYDIYVVASLPTATAAPTATTTKGDLLGLVETQFERSAAPLMSFSGKGEFTYIQNASSRVDIPLCRTVARLDITLLGLKAEQTAELQLTQTSTTPYFKDGPLTTFEFRKDMLTADLNNFYRAYVYENYPSYETDVKTQLNLVVKNSDGSIPTVVYQPIVVNNGAIDRNKIYDIKLTILPDRVVVVNGDAIDWAEVVGGGTLSPLPTLPKANSYIVAPGGDAVFIPVSQVIAANKFDNTIPLIGDFENLTAELVWTDTKGATMGLADDASLAEIAVIGVAPYAQLMVRPGLKPGNSVVAIKGEDGKIKWSWHIWVTDYDPEVAGGQHDVGEGIIFMDRNLGAMAYHNATPDIAGNLQAIGMFYEWGRKDPLPKPNKWGSGTVLADRVAYKANGVSAPITHVYGGTSSTYTYAYTVENPHTFIAGYGNWNWIVKGNWTGKEWGQSADAIVDPKTPYDPCPPGWRVATRPAYAKLVGSTFTFTGYRGAVSAAAIGGKMMYFPSNGYIYYASNSQDETLTSLFSARSTAFDNGTGFLINTTNKGSIVSSAGSMFAPASACNIRCIKE